MFCCFGAVVWAHLVAFICRRKAELTVALQSKLGSSASGGSTSAKHSRDEAGQRVVSMRDRRCQCLTETCRHEAPTTCPKM